MKNYIEQSGEVNGINFDAHYQIGSSKISWYLLGYSVKYEPVMCYCEDEDGEEYECESEEFEEVADTQNVIAVMVGDDRRHRVDVDDLVLIPEDSFCRDCGQIGCQCNVYS